MPVPSHPSPGTSLHRPPNSATAYGRQEDERGPDERPAPAEPRFRAETRPGVEFKEVVRANLHAAAQHAMLGHKDRSFRECPHAACRNASNMVPFPVVAEGIVTDADLTEIFQQVVPAALEKAASSPPSVRPMPEWQPEWQDNPAFVA